MSMETFRTIFDALRDYVQWVGLYNWGEPLLHRDIFDMVRYVSASPRVFPFLWRCRSSHNFPVPPILIQDWCGSSKLLRNFNAVTAPSHAA